MKDIKQYFAPQLEFSGVFAEEILCDSFIGDFEDYDFDNFTW